MTKKKIISILIACVIVVGVIAGCVFLLKGSTTAREITGQQAQEIVNDVFDAMAGTKKALGVIAEKNDILVNSVEYGSEKDVKLNCTLKTVDAYGALSGDYNKFMSVDAKKKDSTMFKSALDFKMEFEDEIVNSLREAKIIEKEVQIYLYDTKEGIKVFTSDEAVNEVYGGIVDVEKEIGAVKSVTITDENGKEQEKVLESGNINKGYIQCIEPKYDNTKPDTSNWIGKTINGIKNDFQKNFIEYDRWQTVLNGLGTTLRLTLFSLIIGVVLGFVVAFIRCTYLKSKKPGIVLKILNSIMQLYLTIIRGTPVVVQIMIIYFLIFMPMSVDKFVSAVICFGLNSGAYVAEIVRGGIMSIDEGQTEAGRSLGFNYIQTMYHIVFPQAFKAVLPALANEFVVLLKETSIAFYIGLGDLMYSVNAIRAATYSPFMPLVAAAVIYLIMVLVLSKLVSILERRLRNSER